MVNKRFGFLQVFVLLVATVIPWRLDAGNPGLNLRVSMDSDTYGVDTALVVKVELVNNGNESVQIYSNLILEDYFLRFDIHGPDGKRVEFLGTEYKIGSQAYTSILLEPRAFFGQFINLREGGGI